jgi:hypothetical protein
MKTAVEWLIEQWPILESQIPERILEQAKEMEKEQHEKTWTEGMFCETGDKQAFIDYYKETFKSE